MLRQLYGFGLVLLVIDWLAIALRLGYARNGLTPQGQIFMMSVTIGAILLYPLVRWASQRRSGEKAEVGSAQCGCVYHAEQGIPCPHDKALL